MPEQTHVYLVYFTRPRASSDSLRHKLGAMVLQENLWLVDWPGTRSRLYHDVKARLHADSALLVARLDHAPKLKGMAPGSTSWVREHFGNASSTHPGSP